MSKSLTDNSASPYGVVTFFRKPLEITGGKIVKAAEVVTLAEAPTSTATPTPTATPTIFTDTLDLNILIDTYNLVKVWDGRYGGSNPEDINMETPTYNTSTTPPKLFMPAPVMPFPQGDDDSRTGATALKMNQFFPPGNPHFAMGNYLNAFALINSGGIKAQTYLIGKQSVYTPFNTQSLTIIYDGAGEPQFARVGIGELNTTLHLGATAKMFEKQADGTYNFGTNGSAQDALGVDDGGFNYNDDIKMAWHLLSGFRKSALGQKFSMLLKNGPRCKGQYDYCVAEAGVSTYVQRVK